MSWDEVNENDKEIARLAAKAVGIEVYYTNNLGGWTYGPNGSSRAEQREQKGWNPLFDDAQAMALSVQLQIGMSYVEDGVVATAGNHPGIGVHVQGPKDREAVRRAIVLVASDIGRLLA